MACVAYSRAQLKTLSSLLKREILDFSVILFHQPLEEYQKKKKRNYLRLRLLPARVGVGAECMFKKFSHVFRCWLLAMPQDENMEKRRNSYRLLAIALGFLR